MHYVCIHVHYVCIDGLHRTSALACELQRMALLCLDGALRYRLILMSQRELQVCVTPAMKVRAL